MEEAEDRDPDGSAEPSTCQGTPPPGSDPLGTSVPEMSHPELVDEIPVGLIEDDLLEDDLCNRMLNSLCRVYKHHKVKSCFIICSRIDAFVAIFLYNSCVWICR